MSVSSVSMNSSVASASDTDTNSTQSSGQTLTQDDFLQLLVAQLSQQDPMNPVSDTDFAAQMAQFTALQETETMQGNMASIQANTLLGQTVEVENSAGTTTSGVVSAVTYSDGTPSLTVDGASYTLSQILSVSPTASTATTSSTAAQNSAAVQSN
jgi:flagellar basal-body rod modification protein FlgD